MARKEAALDLSSFGEQYERLVQEARDSQGTPTEAETVQKLGFFCAANSGVAEEYHHLSASLRTGGLNPDYEE